MRKYLTVLVALAFVLFVIGATAQTSSSSEPQQSTTTTQQGNSTASAPASESDQATEGCLMKEGTDYFLIPRSGNPIQLQAGGQDLAAHEGHKVKVSGPASSLSASTSGQSPTGAASGSGNDLHRLSEKEIMVSKIDHVAGSCPANWNPKVSTSKNGPSKQ
jgi:hypothetical protein